MQYVHMQYVHMQYVHMQYVHIQYVQYTVTSKRMQLFVKFVRHFLTRNMPHFYGLPLDLCGKHIVVLLIKHATLFGQMHRNSENVLHFHGKKAAILELWHLIRRFTFRSYITVQRTWRDKPVPRTAC